MTPPTPPAPNQVRNAGARVLTRARGRARPTKRPRTGLSAIGGDARRDAFGYRAAPCHADVAELVDAHGSGPCGSNPVEVRVLSSALRSKAPPRAGLLRSRGPFAEDCAECSPGRVPRVCPTNAPRDGPGSPTPPPPWLQPGPPPCGGHPLVKSARSIDASSGSGAADQGARKFRRTLGESRLAQAASADRSPDPACGSASKCSSACSSDVATAAHRLARADCRR